MLVQADTRELESGLRRHARSRVALQVMAYSPNPRRS